jgi:hypothetical protein
LARITSVPKVKSGTKSEQEKLMEEAEVVGMQNILDLINDKCKILLHSPHLVHDSLNDNNFIKIPKKLIF